MDDIFQTNATMYDLHDLPPVNTFIMDAWSDFDSGFDFALALQEWDVR